MDATLTVLPLTGIGKSLGYRIPPALAGQPQPGMLVRVPLLNRSVLAVVEHLGHDPALQADDLRYIHRLEQPFPVLSPPLLRLANWMTTYYAAGLDATLEAMIPAALRKGMRPRLERRIRLARRLDAAELAELTRRAPRQAALYAFLAGQLHAVALPRSTILARLGLSPSVADALTAKGVLAEEAGSIHRDAYQDASADGEWLAATAAAGHQLNDEQNAAIAAIRAALAAGSFAVHLLHGVTGSGKTEVYLAALQTVLAAGGGAIYLVPEVALTPQTVGRLRARLEQASGTRAVVWHSHLADGERHDAWRALATGAARLVVGARSAVFAPVPDLRLIVVDEEHEPAYKQEEAPRYHGRDVAVYRASLEGAVCILGSATPSLESHHNALTGKYQINRLPRRVDNQKLPLVHVVDLCREARRQKGATLFSTLLAEKMRDRFDKGEQTILFLNRRGYDTALSCPDCGYVARCDHCDISLTHHRADGRLRCHLCGFEDYAPRMCPHCRSPRILFSGAGTQKVEYYAGRILPQARIVRIDADTMRKRHLFRTLLHDFRCGRIHVLVGTQMIAKGLDFPNVTLVGLMDADISLHLPDFRAHERTFQLLVQVAGRSGRGDRAGEVVVQTHQPHAAPIQFGRRQDYDGFAVAELENRREFLYPPYRHVIHHLFRGKNRDKVVFYADQWVRHLRTSLVAADATEIRGPAPCPVERVQDHFRQQAFYFCPTPSRLVPKLTALRQAFPWDRDIIETLDVDAISMG